MNSIERAERGERRAARHRSQSVLTRQALFPAIATLFKLTREEVSRIRAAQESHASASSIWGRTLSVSSSLWGAATDVASEVSKLRSDAK